VPAARAVRCSAEKESSKQLGTAAAAAALAVALGFGQVDAAFADVAGLTPCKDSKAFAKRQKNEIKGLNKRLKQVPRGPRHRAHRARPRVGHRALRWPLKSRKGLTSRLPPPLAHAQYAEGSAPALALQATIEKTEKRFAKYGSEGLLCGTDGLPHLIADPGLALRYGHAGDILVSSRAAEAPGERPQREPERQPAGGARRQCTLTSVPPPPPSPQIPTVGFVYFAGWIGFAGTKYLQAVRKTDKPINKEIIIDVPLAFKLLWQGFGWPFAALWELKTGSLLEKDSNITVSPR
jgi:photosystem I subunit 3